MARNTRKRAKGGSRRKTGRTYSLRTRDARTKSFFAPVVASMSKTVDELTPAEFDAIFRTVTSKKDWNTKTSRQLGIDNTVLHKIKQNYAVHKIPKTFMSDIASEHTYKVLYHLHQIAPGPVLSLIEPKEGFSDIGIEENIDNITVSDTTSYSIPENADPNDTTRSASYDLSENNLRIRSRVITGVNAMNRSIKYINKDSNISVDDIPIYFVIVIGAEANIHLTILVMYKGQLYSLGLGYSENKIDILYYHEGEMALYSPDYMLLIHNYNKKNRIVDIGILTPTHLAKISEKYLNKINEVTISIDDDDHVTSMLWSCVGCDIKYCTLSTTSSNNRVNCTSFITNIFENIDCNTVFGLVRPGACDTKPPIRREQIDDFFTAYSAGNAYDVVQVLHQQ